MRNSHELAYLAGFFDGEGCVCSTLRNRKYPSVRVTVTQSNPNPLKQYQKLFGGCIAGGTTAFQWCVCGIDAMNTLKILHPYLKLKKKEAEIGLKLLRLHIGNRGIRIKDMSLRLKYHFQLRSYKHRHYNKTGRV